MIFFFFLSGNKAVGVCNYLQLFGILRKEITNMITFPCNFVSGLPFEKQFICPSYFLLFIILQILKKKVVICFFFIKLLP